MNILLYVIGVIVGAGWLLESITIYESGSLIHGLLVVAVVPLSMNVITNINRKKV
jgi:hypothetical protein